MRHPLIEAFDKKHFSSLVQLPDFRPGDTVRVAYKVVEGAKSRIQQFEGIVIRYKKNGAQSTFTVRKIGAGSVGVERVFPVCSPNLDSVVLRARGIVRRARLYYLRDLTGKSARIKNRHMGAPVSSVAPIEADVDSSSVDSQPAAE